MPEVIRIEPLASKQTFRKRVCAYARVSMDSSEMLHSFAAQVSYYEELIRSTPDWEYAGVYADYGLSGTGTKSRDEFNRMIADAERGAIDVILTKSISRFARNTVDLLTTVRRLTELGVEVRFERERINTLSGDGEFLLTLLASFAQEESRSISQNARWAITKRFEQGIPNGHKAPYGYTWDGELYRVVPEQAHVVRDIFSRYLAGESAYSIAKHLAKDGITGASGGPIADDAVRRILSNPSYTGTGVLQKYFLTDAKKKRRNTGELTMYEVEGMYEPIISKETFDAVQAIRAQRAAALPAREVPTPFSGKVRCGICGGGVFRRCSGGRKRWVCGTRERKGMATCSMRPVMEDELMRDWHMLRSPAFSFVTVYDDRVTFELPTGRKYDILRTYGGRKMRGAYSGKLRCGICGAVLTRDTWTLKSGKKIVWVCPKPRKECPAKSIPEETVKAAVQATFGNDTAFVALVDHASCSADQIEFTYKEGGTLRWHPE